MATYSTSLRLRKKFIRPTGCYAAKNRFSWVWGFSKNFSKPHYTPPKVVRVRARFYDWQMGVVLSVPMIDNQLPANWR